MANVIHMTPLGEGKKQRKKLAKQEAKLMLKVEQARKGVQKAQGKATKAQTRLDDSQKRLQTVEEKLNALRTSSWEQQAGTNDKQEQSQEHAVATDIAQGQGEMGVPDMHEPNQNPDEEEDRALPETPQPAELPDQHAPVPPDSQPYTIVAQDEALTDETEPHSSTQP